MRSGLVPILLRSLLADKLLAGETNGLAVSFIDGSMVVRDTATPANNFRGKYLDKLTITGGLPYGPSGATFDANNYASLATSAIPYSATAGSWIVLATVLAYASNCRVVGGDGVGGPTTLFVSGSTDIAMYNAAVALTKTLSDFLGVPTKFASGWDASGRSVTGQGLAVATDAEVQPSHSVINFGSAQGGGAAIIAQYLSALYLPRRLADAEYRARTA